MRPRDEVANCAECGQARTKRTLDAKGVCPWCLLTVVLTADNPHLIGSRQV